MSQREHCRQSTEAPRPTPESNWPKIGLSGSSWGFHHHITATYFCMPCFALGSTNPILTTGSDSYSVCPPPKCFTLDPTWFLKPALPHSFTLFLLPLCLPGDEQRKIVKRAFHCRCPKVFGWSCVHKCARMWTSTWHAFLIYIFLLEFQQDILILECSKRN